MSLMEVRSKMVYKQSGKIRNFLYFLSFVSFIVGIIFIIVAIVIPDLTLIFKGLIAGMGCFVWLLGIAFYLFAKFMENVQTK